jgi:drug/metabolite transporter (DMT)-like permease
VSRVALASVAAVVSLFGWASLYPVAKPALIEVTPVEVALVRAGIAAFVLATLSISISGGPRRGIQNFRRQVTGRPWRVAIVGIISFAGTSLIAMTAQRLLPASINGLLNNLAPLWLAVYAAFAGRARSGPLLIAGSALAAVGVGVVLLGGGSTGDVSLSAQLTLGAAISLGGSVLIAFSQTYTRRLMVGSDPLALTAVNAAWGTLPLLVLVLAGLGGSFPNIIAASGEAKLRLLWLGVGSTALNFSLWAFALAHLPLTRIAPLQYLIAPGGVALSVILLHERLGPELVVGTAAILGGIALAQRGAEPT